MLQGSTSLETSVPYSNEEQKSKINPYSIYYWNYPLDLFSSSYTNAKITTKDSMGNELQTTVNESQDQYNNDIKAVIHSGGSFICCSVWSEKNKQQRSISLFR